MILGSSRAEKIQPSYVESLTGRRTFNASVSAGTPDDTWAFANFLHALPGAEPQTVLWFVDVESFRKAPPNWGLLATPELAPYLTTPFGALPAPVRQCTFRTSPGTVYSAAGFRARDFHDSALQRGLTQSQGLAISVRHYRRTYRRYRELDPVLEARFEQTVALINSYGVRPVIVITPVHPEFERVLGAPWERMHEKLVGYLAGLSTRLDVRVLDESKIHSFGGLASDFYDGVHLKVPNMRRLIHRVVVSARTDLMAITPRGT